MKKNLVLPFLVFICCSLSLIAQEKVKIIIDGTEKLTIQENNNGDLQLLTPNSNNNLFIGSESGDNILSSSGVSGVNNITIGNQVLKAITSGSDNLAMGLRSLTKNATGSFNVGMGTSSLHENLDGNFNIGIGSFSLYNNVGNNKNIAIGYSALGNANNGTTNIDKNNLAIGFEAMLGSTFPSSNTGYNNVALGNLTLRSYTTGYQNTAIGDASMQSNTTGAKNAAVGANALMSNVTGFNNVAMGFEALKMNADGSSNTAIGVSSMVSNTSGTYNTSLGSSAMTFNTQGSSNVAIGNVALNMNTTGKNSVAIGAGSLKNNTTKSGLVAIGDSSLYNNGIGALTGNEYFGDASGNTAIGSKSMYRNTTGFSNTAIGYNSLQLNTVGDRNTAVGFEALFGANNNANDNVAIGYQSGKNNSGSGNIFLGNSAGANETGSSKLYIANTSTTSPLIFGEFDTKRLVVNGKDNDGSSAAFEINGGAQTLLLDGNEIDTKNNNNLSINGNSSGQVKIGIAGNTTTKNIAYGNTFEISNPTAPVLRLDRSSGASYDFEMYMNGPDLRFRGGVNGSGAILNDRVTFEAGGNVGIGITDPDNTLDISGDVNIRAKTGATDLLLLETDDGTDVLEITGGLNPQAELFGYWDISSPEVGLNYPDNTQAMEVNSSFFMNSLGQIRVGNPGGGSTPLSDIHVKQSFFVVGEDDYSPGIRLEINTGTEYWNTYIDASNDYNFAYNNVLKAYIQDSDGVYTVSSDRRLKNNIRNLGAVLPSLMKLSPSQYTFTSDRTNQVSTGFIAQEVQKIFPEFVSEKDGILRIGYDYFIPVAIKGIQELSEDNKQLRKELNELKAEMAEIKALLKK